MYTVLSGFTSALSVDTSGIFLIGIHSYRLPNKEFFAIGLDDENKQITAFTTSFDKINFSYFGLFVVQFVSISIPLIKISSFNTKCSFYFSDMG